MAACDPNTLTNAAKCFDCLDDKMQLAVQTYLLAVIAGVTPDPAALSNLAAGFQGLSDSAILQIQAYLLCKISGG